MAESYPTTKRCSACQEWKSATTEFFRPRKKGKGGLNSACRACTQAYDRRQYQKTQEKILIRKRAWREDNREKICVQARRRRQENPDRVRENARRYREKYPEKSRQYNLKNRKKIQEKARQYYLDHKEEIDERNRRWQQANPDRVREISRRWQQANPDRVRENHRRYSGSDKGQAALRQYRREHRDAMQAAWQKWKEANPVRARRARVMASGRRRARERLLPDTFTTQDWHACLAYWHHACAVCGAQNGFLHILSADHWIPFANPQSPGHTAGNVVPLCHGRYGCNNSKGGKHPKQWLEERLGKRAAARKLKEVQAYFDSL